MPSGSGLTGRQGLQSVIPRPGKGADLVGLGSRERTEPVARRRAQGAMHD
jgi:hypothetical protein